MNTHNSVGNSTATTHRWMHYNSIPVRLFTTGLPEVDQTSRRRHDQLVLRSHHPSILLRATHSSIPFTRAAIDWHTNHHQISASLLHSACDSLVNFDDDGALHALVRLSNTAPRDLVAVDIVPPAVLHYLRSFFFVYGNNVSARSSVDPSKCRHDKALTRQSVDFKASSDILYWS